MIPRDVMELLREYRQHFGEAVPASRVRSYEWIREHVRRALDEDKPLAQPEVPKGAVI